jgi:hypothetical protein
MTANTGSFGCLFCCSMLQGPAPVFGNLHAFMEHLIEHAASPGQTEGQPAGSQAPARRPPTRNGPNDSNFGFTNAGFAGVTGYSDTISKVPSPELLKALKCIIGRVANEHDDFEINIPPKVSEVT